MDANAEGGPPKAEVAEVDVEFTPPPGPPPSAPPQVVEVPSAASLFSMARGERLKEAAERRIPGDRPAPPEAEAEAAAPPPATPSADAEPEPAPPAPTPSQPSPPADAPPATEDKPAKTKKKTTKKAKKAAEEKAAQKELEKAAEPAPEVEAVPLPQPPSPPPKPTLSEEDAARVEAQLRADLAARPPSLDAPLASSIFRSAREPGWDKPVVEQDPEKVAEFQEAEFQRRLRGEYEEAQPSVGDVVSPPYPSELTSGVGQHGPPDAPDFDPAVAASSHDAPRLPEQYAQAVHAPHLAVLAVQYPAPA